MRTSLATRTTLASLAAVLMLAGSSATAQQAPVRTEGPFSPFTYERLGATPSLRLHREATPADNRAAAAAKAQAALKSPSTVGAQEAARAAAARAEAGPLPAATPTAAPAK